MDKELKKLIKDFLWLDTMLVSRDSLWSILDEIEGELEEIFDKGKKSDISLDALLKIKNKE